MSHDDARAAIAAHFDGGNDAGVEHAMFTHLADCDRCRAVYERRAALNALDPEGLSREQRILRGLRGARRPRVSSLTRWSAVAVVAAAATIVFAVVSEQEPDSTEVPGVQVRGGNVNEAQPTLGVYRIAAAGSELVGEQLHADDALAFAYTNPAGAAYLMVFVRASDGAVHWYYPTWTEPEDSPSAVSIVAAEKPHELGDAIRHRLPTGTLDLFAIFADEPLTVGQIEVALESLSPGETLELEGARVQTRSLVVVK
jgi:hypothetical protein